MAINKKNRWKVTDLWTKSSTDASLSAVILIKQHTSLIAKAASDEKGLLYVNSVCPLKVAPYSNFNGAW